MRFVTKAFTFLLCCTVLFVTTPVSAAPQPKPVYHHGPCVICSPVTTRWVLQQVSGVYQRWYQEYTNERAVQAFYNGNPIEIITSLGQWILDPGRLFGNRSTLHDVRDHGATRFRGWGRGTSEQVGGDSAARELFRRLTGRYPNSGIDAPGRIGDREVVYRSAANSTSGYPKVEVMDYVTKFHEVITYKP